MKLEGIPIPPSMNNAYPTNKWGRRYKSKPFVEWERDFRIWCLKNTSRVNEARAEFSKARKGEFISIRCDFFFHRSAILCKDGKPKRNDTSNRLKILHDGISGAIWADDSWFFDGSFSKRVTNLVENCTVELGWVKASWMLGLTKNAAIASYKSMSGVIEGVKEWK